MLSTPSGYNTPLSESTHIFNTCHLVGYVFSVSIPLLTKSTAVEQQYMGDLIYF
jgi:hypothetical protein